MGMVRNGKEMKRKLPFALATTSLSPSSFTLTDTIIDSKQFCYEQEISNTSAKLHYAHMGGFIQS